MLCSQCLIAKKNVNPCASCQQLVCRDCRGFLDAETLFENDPELINQGQQLGQIFCSTCYESQALPLIQKRQELEANAQGVYYWSKSYRGRIPVLEKSSKVLTVAQCKDRGDAILRLSYEVAKHGYNGLLNLEVQSKKVRNEGYQKMAWSAQGLPVLIDKAEIERMEAVFNEFDS